ncbi:hypothetical protein MPSI1_000131 [Malassezia psittaci]|uniref:L-2-hydroxyglutarate dehydrogenase, mitochondrial n=1 Tax=Malassezia psittaci TaxID=1821823 RepID=A0AAF0F863_9BASI|nr:hypothetical protein MPSI1_000131 [Malassezia psittaci]
MPIRPLIAKLNPHGRYAYRDWDVHVDHLVIGAGVVGLAVANALARRWPEKTTYVIERHAQAGQETSSRNSEVIHAGLYYPRDSLKTRFCLRGRDLLYERAKNHSIGAKKLGKLIVGSTSADSKYLESLHEHCQKLGPHAPPTRLLSGSEACQLEPNLSPNITRAMYSPSTGIVSAHDLMQQLEMELDTLPNGESPEAEVVYGTSAVRIDPFPERKGWVVQTKTKDSTHDLDTDSLLAQVVINASGLNAPRTLNSLVEQIGGNQDEMIPMYFSKGSYASYRGPGVDKVRHLLYPTPNFGADSSNATSSAHAHQSLGTHLTLDLEGNVRFGPDTHWLSPEPGLAQTSSSDDAPDFWESQLYPDATEEWYDAMHTAIRKYLPDVQKQGLAPDYSGIRPKLVGPDAKKFNDFQILWHASQSLGQQRVWQSSLPDLGGGTMISLLGIESPGLTSSLAIGEHIAEELAINVWGKRNPSGKAQRYFEHVGQDNLAGWA